MKMRLQLLKRFFLMAILTTYGVSNASFFKSLGSLVKKFTFQKPISTSSPRTVLSEQEQQDLLRTIDSTSLVPPLMQIVFGYLEYNKISQSYRQELKCSIHNKPTTTRVVWTVDNAFFPPRDLFAMPVNGKGQKVDSRFFVLNAATNNNGSNEVNDVRIAGLVDSTGSSDVHHSYMQKKLSEDNQSKSINVLPDATAEVRKISVEGELVAFTTDRRDQQSAHFVSKKGRFIKPSEVSLKALHDNKQWPQVQQFVTLSDGSVVMSMSDCVDARPTVHWVKKPQEGEQNTVSWSGFLCEREHIMRALSDNRFAFIQKDNSGSLECSIVHIDNEAFQVSRSWKLSSYAGQLASIVTYELPGNKLAVGRNVGLVDICDFSSNNVLCSTIRCDDVNISCATSKTKTSSLSLLLCMHLLSPTELLLVHQHGLEIRDPQTGIQHDTVSLDPEQCKIMKAFFLDERRVLLVMGKKDLGSDAWISGYTQVWTIPSIKSPIEQCYDSIRKPKTLTPPATPSPTKSSGNGSSPSSPKSGGLPALVSPISTPPATPLSKTSSATSSPASLSSAPSSGSF